VLTFSLAAAARAQAPPPAPQPAPPVPEPAPQLQEPAPQPQTPPAPAEDPTRTPAGALTLFMASRDYKTIRELRSVMTPALQARYDHNSVSFNGKRGIRLAAFDFREGDVKPSGPKGTEARASVKTLWEEQGEAAELRVEAVRLTAREDGLWRVASLEKTSSDTLRFQDAVPGVTTLRMVLRAWQRKDLASARQQMSQAFLKKYEGRAGGQEALRALFATETSAGSAGQATRRAAYQIVSLDPQGTTGARAQVRLYETVPGRPTSIEGLRVAIGLVKKGPRWFLDAWD